MGRYAYTCGVCGYDLSDRVRGDHCPECNTPLDTRENDPVADRNSSIAVVLMGSALLLMPVLAFIAVILMVLAHFRVLKRHSLMNEYRISAKARRNRKLVRWLTIAWAIEILLMLVISHFDPDAFNWW